MTQLRGDKAPREVNILLQAHIGKLKKPFKV